jgi:hypothetical protein
MRYDPSVAPVPAKWLALDEQERIRLAETHHRAARVELPDALAHAVVHTIVENQLALGLDPVVRALGRLQREGLSRHDAIHAIGSVVGEHLLAIMRSEDQDAASTPQARYEAAIERLDARSWEEAGDSY